jgi:hypothetical protein
VSRDSSLYSNLYIGRVLSYNAATKDASVLIPQLQGTKPLIAQAYINRYEDLTSVLPVRAGDRVLVFFDGGDINSQAYWMVVYNGIVGPAGEPGPPGPPGEGGGEIGDHLAAPDPHPQYALDAELTAALNNYYTQTAVNNLLLDYVPRSGATMTGFLTLHSDTPTANRHAVPKIYVDNHINSSNPHPGIVINLGTNTNGDYVKSVLGTANQISVSLLDGDTEGAVATFALPQNIHTAASPQFTSLILSQTTGTAPLTVQSTTMVANLNANLLGGQDSAYHRNWANLTNKPSPVFSVALTGGVTGSTNATWTSLNGNVSLSMVATVNGGAGSGLIAEFLGLAGQNAAFFRNAGNMNAGILPAAQLSGSYTINVIGSLTGNASTATALQNSRLIAGKSFNGTQDVVLSALTAGTYLVAGGTYDGSSPRTFSVDATSANTAGKVVARDSSGDFSANVITTSRLVSNVPSGTAPLSVSSSTKVSNLNADLLDGKDATEFADREELESLLGDLLYVGLYDAASYVPLDGFPGEGGPKPVPTWDAPDPTKPYRHAMYWVAQSSGNLDFIDEDLSGRFDVQGGDVPVEVSNGDWIIALDPLAGTPGRPVGTNLELGDIVFQYIPFSSETFVKSQISEHESKEDPHAVAGYLKLAQTDARYTLIGHDHDADIESYISQHTQRITYDIQQYFVTDNKAYVYLGSNFTNTIKSTPIVVSGLSPLLNGLHDVDSYSPAGYNFYPNGAFTAISPLPAPSAGGPYIGVARVADAEPPIGDYALRLEYLAGGGWSDGHHYGVHTTVTIPPLPSENGDLVVDQRDRQWSVSLWVKPSTAGQTAFITIVPVAVDGTFYYSQRVATSTFSSLVANEWVRISVTGTVPSVPVIPNAVDRLHVRVGWFNDASATTGASLDLSGVQLQQGDVSKWTDSFRGALVTYDVGTADAGIVTPTGSPLPTVTSEPHPYYLLTQEAQLLFAPIDHNHDEDIFEAIREHEEKADPHPHYLNQSRGDGRYEALGAVNAHVASFDPHEQYLLEDEADGRYEEKGLMAAHLDLAENPDPHAQYLMQDEADFLFAPKNHLHAEYRTEDQIKALIGSNSPKLIFATDGAQSYRIFIGKRPDGDVFPKPALPGDLFIETFDIALEAPDPAANFVASGISTSSIKLTWNAWPAAIEVDYITLERSLNEIDWVAVTTINNGNAVEYTDTGLDEDKTYFYRIRGNNNVSNVFPTTTNWQYAVASANTLNTNPPAPTGLTVTNVTASSARLNWTPPVWNDEGAPGARYEVRLDTGAWLPVSGTSTFYEFTGLTETILYTMSVRAIDRSALQSPVASVTHTHPNAAPPAPGSASLSASTTQPSVTATWTAYAGTIPDFKHYEVRLMNVSTGTQIGTSVITTAPPLTRTFAEVAWGTLVRVDVRTVDIGNLTSAWVPSSNVTTKANPVAALTNSGGSPDDTYTASWSQVTGLDNFSGYEVRLFNSSNTVLATFTANTNQTVVQWINQTFGQVRRHDIRVLRSSGLAPVVSGKSADRTMVADPIPGCSLTTSGNSITVNVTAPSVVPTNFNRYAIELRTSGGALVSTQYRTSVGTVTFTGLSYSTTYQARANVERTSAQNGSWSSYASITVGPPPDTTPPVLPTITSFQPEVSYGRMVARMTWGGGTDHAEVELSRSINGATWAVYYTGARVTESVVGTYSSGTSIRFRARSRDAAGNWSSYATSSTYTLVTSPTAVTADSTNYWRSTTGNDSNGSYNSDGSFRPYQGYFSNSAYNATGYCYYGNKITNACANKTVTKIELTLVRENAGGNNVQDTVYVGTHVETTNPGSPSGVGRAFVSNIFTWGTLAWGGADTRDLGSAARNALAAGTAKGVAMFSSSGKPYMIFQNTSNGFQGLIQVSHLG